MDGEKTETLPLLLNEVDDFYCSLGSNRNRDFTREQAESLIQAIQADCLAETMAQRSQYHDGIFKYLNYEGTPSEDDSIYLSLSGENYGWSITDLLFRRFSENCMRPHPALRATFSSQEKAEENGLPRRPLASSQ